MTITAVANIERMAGRISHHASHSCTGWKTDMFDQLMSMIHIVDIQIAIWKYILIVLNSGCGCVWRRFLPLSGYKEERDREGKQKNGKKFPFSLKKKWESRTGEKGVLLLHRYTSHTRRAS
jgi:hypothetical protein